MHLGVMSKNLVKLASEIGNLVDGFVSRAQMTAPPTTEAVPQQSTELQQDGENDLPRGAVRAFLASKRTECLNKWNDMLEKAPDADYDVLVKSTELDLQVKLTLSGNKYTATIVPEIEPSRNTYGQRALQPYCNGLAGIAGAKATQSIKNATGNSSFGIYMKQYLKFT